MHKNRADRKLPSAARAALSIACATLTSCGGGSGGTFMSGGSGPPQFTSVTQVRVSQAQALPANCDGVPASGTLYPGTAAEPYLAVNPNSNLNLIAAWQQNRWSGGGAQAIGMAVSMDGGMSWTPTQAAFSRCTGGSSSNFGDYARVTDVWLSISPNGVAYALALAFTGQTLSPGSSSGMLVARSIDGGSNWSLPTPLIQDNATVFNDKGSITADPHDSGFIYAVWDRTTQNTGPIYFASSTDGGSTWHSARAIYDPGSNSQTIGNQIVVLPNGTLLNVFTELAGTSAAVKVMQSLDHGATWSAPTKVEDLRSVGTTDPHGGAPVRDGADLVSAAVSPAGVVYLAWQDARFSMGAHDGIALTHSANGGATWSTPVQVNADVAVQAFTPTVTVRADGRIAITYYDLRNAASSTTMLLTDCWMVTSADGVTFTETHLSGPFDLRHAPNSLGLFLGDYESLASNATEFLPFYVETNTGSNISSDAFVAFPPTTAMAQAAAASFTAEAVAAVSADAQVQRRVSERIRMVQAQRRNH